MTVDGSLCETALMLTERIERLVKRQKVINPRRRVLIALAGVPGSGKSTISDALLQLLPEYGIDDLAVLPMASHFFAVPLLTFC
jgi:Mg-chelatase subunit ChlI